MNESTAPLVTLGQIAREFNLPFHIVKYAVSAYQIEPRQRAGIVRLWSQDQLPEIKSALDRIASRREVFHA